MTKVTLTGADEWWPVYGVRYEDSPYGYHEENAIEVPDATVKRWKRTMAAFSRMQDELREMDEEDE